MNTGSSLLLPLAIFGISALDWYVAARKGLAMLNRSPWVIFWACMEVLFGALVGYGFYDAYQTKDALAGALTIGATVLGCAVGCAFSGVVKWK